MRVSATYPRVHLDLLVVRPHADDLDSLFILQNLVHQSMLDVDPAGIGTSKIAHVLSFTLPRLGSEGDSLAHQSS
jgi:hypothetical protein